MSEPRPSQIEQAITDRNRELEARDREWYSRYMAKLDRELELVERIEAAEAENERLWKIVHLYADYAKALGFADQIDKEAAKLWFWPKISAALSAPQETEP